jgi:hypothetical protein
MADEVDIEIQKSRIFFISTYFKIFHDVAYRARNRDDLLAGDYEKVL